MVGADRLLSHAGRSRVIPQGAALTVARLGCEVPYLGQMSNALDFVWEGILE